VILLCRNIDRSKSFLLIAKVFILSTILQDGFGVCDPSRKSAFRKCAQHSVHPTGGSLRVFRQFVWLEVDSIKTALSRPAHQPVTQAVGRHKSKSYFEGTPLKNRTQCTHTNICAFFNPFWVHRVLSRVAAFFCHGSLRNCGANCVDFP